MPSRTVNPVTGSGLSKSVGSARSDMPRAAEHGSGSERTEHSLRSRNVVAGIRTNGDKELTSTKSLGCQPSLLQIPHQIEPCFASTANVIQRDGGIQRSSEGAVVLKAG